MGDGTGIGRLAGPLQAILVNRQVDELLNAIDRIDRSRSVSALPFGPEGSQGRHGRCCSNVERTMPAHVCERPAAETKHHRASKRQLASFFVSFSPVSRQLRANNKLHL